MTHQDDADREYWDEPEPPDHPEFDDVETWTMGPLEYPVPGDWEIAANEQFLTKWEHADGAVFTRSFRRHDHYALRLDGEEVYQARAADDRKQMREVVVRMLVAYDEGAETIDELRAAAENQETTALGDFS